MRVRIRLAGAIEAHGCMALQLVIGWIESRMLSREDESRCEAANCKGGRNGCKLDRLGPGADDENYAAGQPSP